MSRLREYYDSRVASLSESAFLKQVGHTEHGLPVTGEQFESMLTQISDLLEIHSDDTLLDLCCGNGIFTQRLASMAADAVGVEFSGAFVKIADGNFGADKLRFHQLDVRELEGLSTLEERKFSKVLMYAALQHFERSDLEPLLRKILELSAQNVTIVLGFVPEKGREGFLHNTAWRKIKHLIRRIAGKDIFGTWWSKAFISETCDKLNLSCTFQDIDESLLASRYRFDVKIVRQKDGRSIAG